MCPCLMVGGQNGRNRWQEQSDTGVFFVYVLSLLLLMQQWFLLFHFADVLYAHVLYDYVVQ